jgi:hypothetical protein
MKFPIIKENGPGRGWDVLYTRDGGPVKYMRTWPTLHDAVKHAEHLFPKMNNIDMSLANPKFQ